MIFLKNALCNIKCDIDGGLFLVNLKEAGKNRMDVFAVWVYKRRDISILENNLNINQLKASYLSFGYKFGDANFDIVIPKPSFRVV